MSGSFEAGSIVAKVKADLSDFKQGMDDAKKQTSTLKGHLEDSADASKKFAAGMTLVAGAAVGVGILTVKAFEDSQNKIAQTNAVLKSTAGIAGVTADEVTKLATALEKQTKYSDEDVRSVENLLLTFTSIGKDIFPQATSTVLDMATALGEDTSSASIQLGKALQDPVLGITALRRVGVNFSEDQKNVIQNLVETGHKAEAQKMILKELNTEFGGSAKAAGETFAGKLQILKNQLNNVEEAVGGLLIHAIQPIITGFLDWFNKVGGVEGVMKKLKDILDQVKPYFPEIIGAIVGGLIPAFVVLGISIWSAMAPLLPFLAAGAALGYLAKTLADQLGGWGPLWTTIKNAIQGVWDVVGPILIPAFQALWNVIATQLWPALVNLWNSIGPTLIPVVKFLAEALGAELVVGVWLAVNVLRIIIDVISWLINTSISLVGTIVNVVQAIGGWFGRLPGYIASAASAVVDWFGRLPGMILHAIGDVGHLLYDIGKKIIDGLINGIKDKFGDVKDTLGNLTKKLTSWKGPESVDKKILFGAGRFVIGGFVEGLQSSFGDVQNTLGSLTASLAPATLAAQSNDNSVRTTIYGGVNIGSNVDADNFMARLTKNQELTKKGLTPV